MEQPGIPSGAFVLCNVALKPYNRRAAFIPTALTCKKESPFRAAYMDEYHKTVRTLKILRQKNK